LGKWEDKFKVKFHLHFDGEFLIKSRGGVQRLQGTGGHNHSVIGENLRVRRYLTRPKDNLPFDALISVRYSQRGRYMGKWVDKQSKSSMFPMNWDITRVKQEIALVYEDMVESGYTLRFENNKWRGFVSDKKFEIIIEVDKQGNITNAYPLKQ